MVCKLFDLKNLFALYFPNIPFIWSSSEEKISCYIMPLSRESMVDFDKLLRLPHSCNNSWIPQVHHYAHKSAALDLLRSR